MPKRKLTPLPDVPCAVIDARNMDTRGKTATDDKDAHTVPKKTTTDETTPSRAHLKRPGASTAKKMVTLRDTKIVLKIKKKEIFSNSKKTTRSADERPQH